MNGKRFLVISGVAVALVFALTAGVLIGGVISQNVLAQGPTPGQGFGPGMMGRGFGQTYTGTVPCRGGMMGDAAGYGYNDVMLPALAKVLGLTVDQLNAELKAGKTVLQIAQAKGISAEKLQADLLTAHKDALLQLVKDGKLTQAQSDAMQQRMSGAGSLPCITGNVTPGASGQGFGPGGMMGGRGGMMGRGAGFSGRTN